MSLGLRHRHNSMGLNSFTTYGSRLIIFTVTCPMNCTCSRSMTVVKCEGRWHQKVPDNLPMIISELQLNYNNISNLTAEDFAGCRLLKALYLRYNRIHLIENGTFAETVNLQTLFLNENQIDFGLVPEDLFGALKNLKDLRIHNNLGTRTQCYPGHLFTNLENLKYLHIDGVPDTPFPKEFLRLKRLAELTIFNELTAIHNDTFEALAGCPVKKLYIKTRFHLLTLEPMSFGHFRQLHKLDLG
jgi:Leucine rich repeat/BspA type Leucine rich repeat region (6 copies)